MNARVGWLLALLGIVALVGAGVGFVLLWLWPILVDLAAVVGFLFAIFVGGAEWTA